MVTRCTSRYCGGRFSRLPTSKLELRRSPTRSAWLCNQRRVKWKVFGAQRLGERGEVGDQVGAGHRRLRQQETLVAQQGDEVVRPILQREPGHHGQRPGQAVGQPRDRAEVEHQQPAVGQQLEVARVRVGVQQPRPGGSAVVELREQRPGLVALLRRTARDHLRQFPAAHPLAHHRARRRGHHPRHGDQRVAVEDLGEGALVRRLVAVVELLLHALAQLVDQRFDVLTRHQRLQQPAHPRQLPQVRPQRLLRARVLDLDRDLAAVVPHRAVHLPDAGGRGGRVVELAKPLGPAAAELLGEHPVDVAGRHRRRGVLQLRQRLAERARQLVGHRGLEDRQRLPELHRAALELAQHGEKLLGAARHQLCGDLLTVAAGEAPAPPGRGPARDPEGKAGELGRARGGTPRDVTHFNGLADAHHLMIVPRSSRGPHVCAGGGAPHVQSGCAGHGRRSSSPEARSSSRVAPSTGGARRPAAALRRPGPPAPGRPPTPRLPPPPRHCRGPGRPTSCAVTAGQPGSRAHRCSSTHPRHADRPGSTSGPTIPVPSRSRTGRCATRSRCSAASRAGSGTTASASTHRSGAARAGGRPALVPGATRRTTSTTASTADRPRSPSRRPVPRSPSCTAPSASASIHTLPTPASASPVAVPAATRPPPTTMTAAAARRRATRSGSSASTSTSASTNCRSSSSAASRCRHRAARPGRRDRPAPRERPAHRASAPAAVGGRRRRARYAGPGPPAGPTAPAAGASGAAAAGACAAGRSGARREVQEIRVHARRVPTSAARCIPLSTGRGEVVDNSGRSASTLRSARAGRDSLGRWSGPLSWRSVVANAAAGW